MIQAKCVAFIPDRRVYVLRRDQRLELWRPIQQPDLYSIHINGIELEYVRDVDGVYRVIDNPTNRATCPDEIGKVYIDRKPAVIQTQEII